MAKYLECTECGASVAFDFGEQGDECPSDPGCDGWLEEATDEED